MNDAGSIRRELECYECLYPHCRRMCPLYRDGARGYQTTFSRQSGYLGGRDHVYGRVYAHDKAFPPRGVSPD